MPRMMCNQAAMRLVEHPLGHVVPPLKKDFAATVKDDLTAVLAARALPVVFEPRREAEQQETATRMDDIEAAATAAPHTLKDLAKQDSHDSESLVSHPSSEGGVSQRPLIPQASKVRAMLIPGLALLLLFAAGWFMISSSKSAETVASSSRPFTPSTKAIGGHPRRPHLEHHHHAPGTAATRGSVAAPAARAAAHAHRRGSVHALSD